MKTLRVRIKDKHRPLLLKWAGSVNFVWNYLNELSNRAIVDKGVFLSDFDMHVYTVGASKEMGLHSHTLSKIAAQYVASRRKAKKIKLAWRKSSGTRRSLGWVPFNVKAVKFKDGRLYHNGNYLSIWDSYGLDKYEMKSGCFSEDARGNWYLNVCVESPHSSNVGTEAIGVDLGLKDTATCSDGTRMAAGRYYRDSEEKLAASQRAGHKKRTRAIHRKIANRRKDALHKFTTTLISRCGLIVIGDVSSKKLVKTAMAKSVLDSGWGQFKTMLGYKCDNAGVVLKVVNEAYTTQTCSACGSLPTSRPKGIAGLGIREWTCSDCGAVHDRDVNAARNILALGHGRLPEGIH